MPIKPALVLPEILDDKAWYGGLDFGFQDKEKLTNLAFDFTVSAPMYVNWDFVKRDELKTFSDLLKPKFANKIVWSDPRRGGPGIATGVTVLFNFGEDFLGKLTGGQKIAYTSKGRQIAEWIVKGRYPIGLGAGAQNLLLFQRQGLGKNISVFYGDADKRTGGPGFGTVALMDRAPNPNAAKLYVNWLLSKEGQLQYAAKSGRNSRRLDVPPGNKDLVPQAGVKYLDSQRESAIPVRAKVVKIARKNIQTKRKKK